MFLAVTAPLLPALLAALAARCTENWDDTGNAKAHLDRSVAGHVLHGDRQGSAIEVVAFRQSFLGECALCLCKMCLPTVNKFLCCCQLKIGVLVIGVLSLVNYQSPRPHMFWLMAYITKVAGLLVINCID